MQIEPFDSSKHIYKSSEFVELVKDAIRFFNGTPVRKLPPEKNFSGAGIYALYYTGNFEIYAKYGILNRLAYNFPIYVGKAVPNGWRQSRTSSRSDSSSRVLFNRIREHSKNIEKVSLDIHDFSVRFVIFEGECSDMISTVEAGLIKLHRPLWNVALDGFGNHTPGAGRFQQAKSDWDVIHPGRIWADKCSGRHKSKDQIISNIKKHLESLE
jgi:hypothetical protein